VDELEAHGLMFVGQDVDAQRMEIMELQGDPLFVFISHQSLIFTLSTYITSGLQ